MVGSLPSSAGDVGSIPGRGTRIPRAAGQLSPCAATKTQRSQIIKLKKKKKKSQIRKLALPDHSPIITS